jgi:hypothetical protein
MRGVIGREKRVAEAARETEWMAESEFDVQQESALWEWLFEMKHEIMHRNTDGSTKRVKRRRGGPVYLFW